MPVDEFLRYLNYTQDIGTIRLNNIKSCQCHTHYGLTLWLLSRDGMEREREREREALLAAAIIIR